ncbi:MAG: transglycosylase SLT domain-containing protein [Bacteroidota bacterium]
MLLKYIVPFIVFVFVYPLGVVSLIANPSNNPDAYNEALVIERINQMPSDVLKPRYTSVVKSYVKTYTIWNKDKAEGILGRAVMYFPIFDKYIEEYDMPKDLRYLSVVESALHAHATSRVGAVGLWQFMPPTAQEMGLEMTKYVDERCDPHKSTAAAMRYLKRQYNRFGSWELALAAYNGGSGRVSRAVKRGRSKNFWRIRKYLPKETRNYIPAFIGASYMMNYYQEHDMRPALPSLDIQLTETITIYDYLTMLRISKLTGMEIKDIEYLNPAYQRGFIPSNVRGNTLTLPKRVMSVVKEYLELRRPDKNNATLVVEDNQFNFQPSVPLIDAEEYYRPVIYEIQEGESLYELAMELDLPIAAICAWNGMKHPFVVPGQQLNLYGVRMTPAIIALNELPKIDPIKVVDALPVRPLLEEVEAKGNLPEHSYEKEGILYYNVTRKESLTKIAAKFSSVTVQDLMILNNLRSNQLPKAGRQIKIKKLKD